LILAINVQQNALLNRPMGIGMNSPGLRPKVQSSWRLVLALLCISLVVACGAIQVVHAHPQGNIAHSDCALCATAHVSVQVVDAPVNLHHVAPVISVVEAFVASTPAQTVSTFALFTRPPPVGLVLA
jgi:hypothetical protein